MRRRGGACRAFEPGAIRGDRSDDGTRSARGRCAGGYRNQRIFCSRSGGLDCKVLSASEFCSEARMTFPVHRPRRLRRTEALRGFVRETRLTTSGLVYPMFACPGQNVRTEVNSMPGIYQQSVDRIVEECREVADLGIPAVILFGLPEHKDELGSEAADARGAVQRSIEAIGKAKLNLLAIADVCLCEYTS